MKLCIETDLMMPYGALIEASYQQYKYKYFFKAGTVAKVRGILTWALFSLKKMYIFLDFSSY